MEHQLPIPQKTNGSTSPETLESIFPLAYSSYDFSVYTEMIIMQIVKHKRTYPSAPRPATKLKQNSRDSTQDKRFESSN